MTLTYSGQLVVLWSWPKSSVPPMPEACLGLSVTICMCTNVSVTTALHATFRTRPVAIA